MTVVVPLRQYNLGNALSVLGTLMLLADRIDGGVLFKHFEQHEDLFEGSPSRYGALTKEDERFARKRMTRLKMFTSDLMDRLADDGPIHTDEWFDYYEITEDALVVNHSGKYYRPLEEIDEELLRRYRMVGLWRPYQYSYQVAVDARHLREALRLSPAYLDAATESNARAKGDRPRLVGIHLRLGDFRTWRQGRYLFELKDVLRLARVVEEQFPGEFAYRIFSNDLDPAETQRRLESDAMAEVRCTFEPADALTDFCGLSQCDVVFGPPSSFGHWAAFLGSRPRVVFNDLAIQQHVITPRYVDALPPVSWPFSVGLENDFWIA